MTHPSIDVNLNFFHSEMLDKLIQVFLQVSQVHFVDAIKTKITKFYIDVDGRVSDKYKALSSSWRLFGPP